MIFGNNIDARACISISEKHVFSVHAKPTVSFDSVCCTAYQKMRGGRTYLIGQPLPILPVILLSRLNPFYPMTVAMTASTSMTTASLDTSSYGYDSLFGTSTTSSTAASTTDSREFPVFPNGAYLSRFYLVVAQESGLTDLDIDLYNECYLPYNPLPHHNFRRGDATTAISPKPTYLIDEAPCQRQAGINSNCYFWNTNGTFSGLVPYSDHWDVQQQCYCDIYPFFDSAAGCQECIRKHGGIEGRSFPQNILALCFSLV